MSTPPRPCRYYGSDILIPVSPLWDFITVRDNVIRQLTTLSHTTLDASEFSPVHVVRWDRTQLCHCVLRFESDDQTEPSSLDEGPRVVRVSRFTGSPVMAQRIVNQIGPCIQGSTFEPLRDSLEPPPPCCTETALDPTAQRKAQADCVFYLTSGVLSPYIDVATEALGALIHLLLSEDWSGDYLPPDRLQQLAWHLLELDTPQTVYGAYFLLARLPPTDLRLPRVQTALRLYLDHRPDPDSLAWVEPLAQLRTLVQ